MSKRLPPFHNVYKLRTVSDSDVKPCYICYKSTPNVLITLKSSTTSTTGGQDFFYICKSHLNDSNFCTIKHIPDNIDDQDAYKQLQQEIQGLQKKQFNAKEHLKSLELKKQEAENANSTQLSNLVNYFTTTKKKDSEGDTEKSSKENKDDELGSKLTEARKNLDQVTNELNHLKAKNTKYQLDNSYYQMRLSKHIKAIKQIELQKKMNDPAYFPSVADLPVIGAAGAGAGAGPGAENQ